MECNECEFRPELYYDKEFQIWLQQESDGCFKVGMTDISQTIAGRILHVRVRRPGTQRPVGKPVATVESGKWAGPVPNLMDCIIVEANETVLNNPANINKDPYGAWIARVKPSDEHNNGLADFVTGESARQAYCQRALDDDIVCKRS